MLDRLIAAILAHVLAELVDRRELALAIVDAVLATVAVLHCMLANPLYRSERLRHYINTRLHHGGAVVGAGALLTISDDGGDEEGEDDGAKVGHGLRLLW